MRCILCQKLSFFHICRGCQQSLLHPTPSLRILDGGFRVYSFYRYSEITPLLLTKHAYIGSFVYHILAENSLAPFAKKVTLQNPCEVVGIDDRPKGGYSHTAILAHALKSAMMRPRFGLLRAGNDITYAGKSLHFRQTHPREFRCGVEAGKSVILVDDIVTTGTTILEAANVVEKVGAIPLFAITLADAREI
ncbi:MAG: hypothetical protein B6D59_04585 [Campylobacteraceae bacterium 4484_4]|nr:MAG: hypothetical protein B6D59_04585 [Campylobacteraceae bacterium 4484_4]